MKISVFRVSTLLLVLYTVPAGADDIKDYLVQVKTGNVFFAGTDAKIFMTIDGDKGTTGETAIEDFISSNNPFENGDLDTFTLSNFTDVGKLQRVTVRNERRGFSPNWFLSTITINNGIATFNRWVNGGKTTSEIIVTIQGEEDESSEPTEDTTPSPSSKFRYNFESSPSPSPNIRYVSSSPDKNSFENTDTKVDDTITEVTAGSLSKVVPLLGDGSGLTFASYEQGIDTYRSIHSLDENFGNTNYYFTSFTRKGYDEDISEDKIKTKISWTQSYCVCVDLKCERRDAIDIRGVYEVDNGEVRGYTPLKFLDENGEALPCLSHPKLPTIQDLQIQGCSWKDVRNRHVHKCGPNGIDGLRFTDRGTGRVYARSINKSEIVPILSRADPDLSIEKLLKSPLFMIPESVVELETTISVPGVNFEIPVQFTQDLAPILNVAKDQFLVTFFNAIAGILRPEDFPPENPGSNATLAEIIRLSDRFSIARLILSVEGIKDIVNTTVYSSPLYMNLKGSRAETSPAQEIWSGVGTLIIQSCALGILVGGARRILEDFGRWNVVFSIGTALIVLGTEIIAFSLRWMAEVDQNSFQEAMVLIVATGADRFDGLLPLGVGMDGKYFAVTTYIVELSDASSNMTWLFVAGTVVSAFCLLTSVRLANHIV